MLQRRLWKLRAMTEEKLDELAQQFGGPKDSLRDLDEEDLGRRGAVRAAGGAVRAQPSVRPLGPGGAGAPARRGPRPAAGRRETSRSRSPERRPTRRVASLARRLHPPDSAGRRRIQPPVPRERAHLRRAARGHPVRPAAADRPDPPGPGAGEQLDGGRRGAVPPLLSAPRLHAGPGPVRRHRAAAGPGLAEPGPALALRHPGVRLVQHPALRRDPHLAQRDLRHLGAARRRGATSCSTLLVRQAAGHRDGGRDGGAVPGQHAAHHRTGAAPGPGCAAGARSWPSSCPPSGGCSASCSRSPSRSRSST